MRKRWIKVVILACFLIFILSVILTPFITPLRNESIYNGGIRKASLPFSIVGDAELALNATLGNGTMANPYILENYDINVTVPFTHGISIWHTSAYFTLRGCNITGTSPNGYAGIWLVNVTNANLSFNTLTDNHYGIQLTSSHDNIISNNIIADNYVGISLNDGNANNLSNNVISSNSRGIAIYNSILNHIFSNSIVVNNGGIRLEKANRTNVFSNTISHNIYGIELYLAHSNAIKWNTLQGNSISISEESSSNNIITDNYSSINTSTMAIIILPFAAFGLMAFGIIRETKGPNRIVLSICFTIFIFGFSGFMLFTGFNIFPWDNTLTLESVFISLLVGGACTTICLLYIGKNKTPMKEMVSFFTAYSIILAIISILGWNREWWISLLLGSAIAIIFLASYYWKRVKYEAES